MRSNLKEFQTCQADKRNIYSRSDKRLSKPAEYLIHQEGRVNVHLTLSFYCVTTVERVRRQEQRLHVHETDSVRGPNRRRDDYSSKLSHWQ